MQGKVTIICKMCVLCDAFTKFCLIEYNNQGQMKKKFFSFSDTLSPPSCFSLISNRFLEMCFIDYNNQVRT